MSLKNAAVLAFVGSLALALLLTRDFVNAVVAAKGRTAKKLLTSDAV
jgi:hypothetical protein